MLSLGFPALQSVQLVDFGTVASDSLTPLPSIAALAGRSRAKSQAASPDDDADLSDRGKVPSGLESLDEEAADSVEVAGGVPGLLVSHLLICHLLRLLLPLCYIHTAYTACLQRAGVRLSRASPIEIYYIVL